VRQQPERRPRRPEPAPIPKGNPTPVYIGVGVGAVALVLILFFAFGSSEEPKERRSTKPKAAPPVEAPNYTRPQKPDTGSILFVCANSGKHEDEEVILGACPCGAQRKFYVDKEGGGYRCLSCAKIFDNAQVKCPKCGRVAAKTHLRPSFN